MKSFIAKTILATLTASALFIAAPEQANAKIIEQERSLYQNVYMVEEYGMHCMRFRKKNKNDLSQSCVFLDAPEIFVFDYYKQAMGATFFLKDPKEILIIGLGGGVLANTFGEVYPDAHITSVEIDPVVVKMAKKYFDYDDSKPNFETHVRDGRVFVKRALKDDKRYDFILLDAFNSDYIPEHMMTKEYLEEVKELAKDDGIIMANTFSTSDLFHHESATYAEVFGPMYQINFKNKKTNRVIVVSKKPLPEKRQLLQKANELKGELLIYGVDTLALFDAISDEVNWDTEAEVLTDQFSPANLLK